MGWAATRVVMKRIIILGIILLAVAAWRYGSLSRHYVSTQGTISCLHPHEHQSFDYLYTVAGTAYLGTTVPLESGRDFASIKIGDHLTVFYDAKHPADSTAGPRRREALCRFGYSYWAALCFHSSLFSGFGITSHTTSRLMNKQSCPLTRLGEKAEVRCSLFTRPTFPRQPAPAGAMSNA